MPKTISPCQEPGGDRYLVFVIDDEPSVRKAISRLFASVGVPSETFGSAEEFLERDCYEGLGCILIDLIMPGLSGADLQAQLAMTHYSLPIVFMTGDGTLPAETAVMKNGVVGFLRKPFDDEDLLQTVEQAITKHHESEKSGDGSARYWPGLTLFGSPHAAFEKMDRPPGGFQDASYWINRRR